ncbi:unnamed protein product, partial [Rotaria sordida]
IIEELPALPPFHFTPLTSHQVPSITNTNDNIKNHDITIGIGIG